MKPTTEPSTAADVGSEIPNRFDFQQVCEAIYGQWEESGSFHAEVRSDRTPFTIVIPPPNVTGMLTLGHVLNCTIQDILARKARMEGKEVLWLPGIDHAALATWRDADWVIVWCGEVRSFLGTRKGPEGARRCAVHRPSERARLRSVAQWLMDRPRASTAMPDEPGPACGEPGVSGSRARTRPARRANGCDRGIAAPRCA